MFNKSNVKGLFSKSKIFIFITAEGFVICEVTAKIFVVYFHKIKS